MKESRQIYRVSRISTVRNLGRLPDPHRPPRFNISSSAPDTPQISLMFPNALNSFLSLYLLPPSEPSSSPICDPVAEYWADSPHIPAYPAASFEFRRGSLRPQRLRIHTAPVPKTKTIKVAKSRPAQARQLLHPLRSGLLVKSY